MATDTSILAQNEPRLGIKAETTYGTTLDSTAADDTAYRQLPVVTASVPKIELIRESRLLSGRGFVKNAADTYTNDKGGTVSCPFDFWATPKLLSQFLVLVGQVHSEAENQGSEVHTISFDDSGMIGRIGGTISSGIPQSVNLAYLGRNVGASYSEGIRVNGSIVSDLSLDLSAGSNSNNLAISGNFFSGHSYMANGNAQTTSATEQSFNIGNWTAPETSHYNLAALTTKTLDVDDAAAQDFILKNVSFSISNGANRVGYNSNGDAQIIALPEYAITGSLTIKYDANFDYGATRDVLQDFMDGDTLSLSLQWGDGTVSSAGEMNISAELQYTGVDQDISESGIFHVLPFECVVNSSTPALKFEMFTGEAISAW